MGNLIIENVVDGETIYQRCLLVIGRCETSIDKKSDLVDHVTVRLTSARGAELFPMQAWPVDKCRFKALVILAHGHNTITFERTGPNGIETTTLSIIHTTALSVPPVHLAIMLCKDSVGKIDCPLAGGRALIPGNSDLEAAVSKFQMTMLMLQAVIAENMRLAGCGRRSFRMDEEWAKHTLSREYFERGRDDESKQPFGSVPRVNIVSSNYTVSEVRRDRKREDSGYDVYDDIDLVKAFRLAVEATPSSANVRDVATVGLILDSRYSAAEDKVFGAVSDCQVTPDNAAYAVQSSEAVYSWPRCLEEITTSLSATQSGSQKGTPVWMECATSQTQLLRILCKALARAEDDAEYPANEVFNWPGQFSTNVHGPTNHPDGDPDQAEAHELSAISIDEIFLMRHSPFLALPDETLQKSLLPESAPALDVEMDGDDVFGIVVECPAGIGGIWLNGNLQSSPSVKEPLTRVMLSLEKLEEEYNGGDPLYFTAVGLNGKTLRVHNLWHRLHCYKISDIKIPETDLTLKKKSVTFAEREERDEEDFQIWKWTVLLHKEGPHGKLIPATMLDSRVSVVLDAATVQYEDGEIVPCGPRWDSSGKDPDVCDYLAEKVHLPAGTEVPRVDVGRNLNDLNGLRYTLSNGDAGGDVGGRSWRCEIGEEVIPLVPGPDERIIGFFGESYWECGSCPLIEFGIITAPRDQELPLSVYRIPELQNTDGGLGARPSSDDNMSEEDDSQENASEDDEAMEEDEEDK